MNLNLIRIFVLPMVFSSFLFSQSTGKISLETAIAEGLKKDGNYLNAVLDEERADLQWRLAAKNKLFRLGFDGNYLYRSETMVIEFAPTPIPGGGLIPGREIEAGLNHNFDLKLGLTQPLFTGGILANSVRQAEVDKTVQANQKFLMENEISGLIKSSYFQYLFLVRRQESFNTLKKTLDLHLRRIENLLDEGLARKSDLLETLSQVEEVQLNIKDTEQAVESERIHFRKLCGFNPEEIDDTYREKPASQDEAVAYFKEHHPVLKNLQNQVEMISLQKKITAGKYLPQVSGFAELHYGKPGIDYFAKKWSLYFQGGIVVTIPVFDWNRLRGEKAIQDLQQQKIVNQRNQFVREITASLENLYSVLQKLEEKRGHVMQLIAYSEEDAGLKEALYAERQIPNVDYLTALLAREKNALAAEELRIQIEKTRVGINTLIGKNKEGV